MGHDIKFRRSHHDPNLMPRSISSTSTSTEVCLEFATLLWLSNVSWSG